MIQDGLQEALELIKIEGSARLMAQGHNASGDGIRSLRVVVDKFGNDYKGYLLGNYYLVAQETGIKPNDYKAHIDNLVRWLKVKNITLRLTEKGGRKLNPSNPNTYRKIAYAIANTHKIKGMHTRGGELAPQYQGWLSDTISENQQKVKEIILKEAKQEFEILINAMINEANRNISNK